jgi:hypothetical protein
LRECRDDAFLDPGKHGLIAVHESGRRAQFRNVTAAVAIVQRPISADAPTSTAYPSVDARGYTTPLRSTLLRRIGARNFIVPDARRVSGRNGGSGESGFEARDEDVGDVRRASVW